MLSGSAMIRIINTDRNSLCSFFLFHVFMIWVCWTWAGSCLWAVMLWSRGWSCWVTQKRQTGSQGVKEPVWLQIFESTRWVGRLLETNTPDVKELNCLSSTQPWTMTLSSSQTWNLCEVLENEWHVTLMFVGWSRTSPPPGTMHLEGGAFSQAQKNQKTTETLDVFCKFSTWNTYILDYSVQKRAPLVFVSLSTATDPLCSVIRLCFPEEILQLFPPLLAVEMAGHMLHMSAFWQLSLGRVVFSSQYRGDKSVISPIIFSFSSAVFTQARRRLCRDSCSSVGPRRDPETGSSLVGLELWVCCMSAARSSWHWTVGSATFTPLDYFF